MGGGLSVLGFGIGRLETVVGSGLRVSCFLPVEGQAYSLPWDII